MMRCSFPETSQAYTGWGSLIFIAVIAFITLTPACRGAAKTYGARADTAYTDSCNTALIRTAVAAVKNGDIVLRKGKGADSYLLAMLNQKDKRYSHCGIVIMENGYPFVYHSIGGEDNPDARLRRDSASFFFSPLHNTAIAVVRFDYDSSTIARLRDTVHSIYRTRPRFDLKFDLNTDSTLYCSEFVYKSLNKATGDTNYIGTSLLSGKRFVGIDDIFINRHARVIWQTEYKQYLCPLK